MQKRLMTLDLMGYVSDPSIILDKVLYNYFVANYSQTAVHYGDIQSLPWQIQHYGQDFFGLSSAIRISLSNLLTAYFDEVDSDVQINPKDDDTDSIEYDILITISARRASQQFDGGKLLHIVDNRIFNIKDITD